MQIDICPLQSAPSVHSLALPLQTVPGSVHVLRSPAQLAPWLHALSVSTQVCDGPTHVFVSGVPGSLGGPLGGPPTGASSSWSSAHMAHPRSIGKSVCPSASSSLPFVHSASMPVASRTTAAPPERPMPGHAASNAPEMDTFAGTIHGNFSLSKTKRTIPPGASSSAATAKVLNKAPQLARWAESSAVPSGSNDTTVGVRAPTCCNWGRRWRMPLGKGARFT